MERLNYRAWLPETKKMVLEREWGSVNDDFDSIEFKTRLFEANDCLYEATVADWGGGADYPDIDRLAANGKYQLMEWFGLVDQTTKKIFVGDIVVDGQLTGHVFYDVDYCRYRVQWSRGTWSELTVLKASGIKVVGNIYENPELLEDSI